MKNEQILKPHNRRLTHLHFANHNRNLQVVQYLIGKDANIEGKDYQQNTFLYFACQMYKNTLFIMYVLLLIFKLFNISLTKVLILS